MLGKFKKVVDEFRSLTCDLSDEACKLKENLLYNGKPLDKLAASRSDIVLHKGFFKK